MRKITECKISLMEKDNDFSIDDSGQGNYIIRSTGSFNPEEYLESHPVEDITSKGTYEAFIENAIGIIYDHLVESSKDKKIDTVGLWLTFEDGEIIDNAMDITLLESIAEYSEEGVIPILEFIKMTFQSAYESEIDS